MQSPARRITKANCMPFEFNQIEVLDLGDCRDDEAAKRAIKVGFDVIECPDFWEQPETIAFDPNKVDVDTVYPVIDANDADDYENLKWTPEGDENVDELKAQGFVGNSVYRSDRRMEEVRKAAEEYSKANDTSSAKTREPIGIMERFPSMFSKAPANKTRTRTNKVLETMPMIQGVATGQDLKRVLANAANQGIAINPTFVAADVTEFEENTDAATMQYIRQLERTNKEMIERMIANALKKNDAYDDDPKPINGYNTIVEEIIEDIDPNHVLYHGTQALNFDVYRVWRIWNIISHRSRNRLWICCR